MMAAGKTGSMGTTRKWIFLFAALVILASVIVFYLLAYDSDSPEDSRQISSAGLTAVCVALAMFLVIAVAVVSEPSVRSVARYTVIQCLRMKLVGVFIVLLAVALLGMYHLEGDGTLGGRIQTFLAYSCSIVSLLLSVMTVFVAISVVATDVRTKQIFLLASKPLARWQYIIGRWLGVVLLNVILLFACGATIYVVSLHLRATGKHMNFEDRRTVETEVFTARRRIAPDPPPIRKMVAGRINRMRSQGRYESNVRAFLTKSGGDMELAGQLLHNEIAKRILVSIRSVGPGRQLWLPFSGVRTEYSKISDTGKVIDVNPNAQLIRIAIPPALIGHLVLGGPVNIGGTDGRIYRVGNDFLDAEFSKVNAAGYAIESLTAGKEVKVTIVSTIQLLYKIKAADKLGGQDQLRGAWLVANPVTRAAQAAKPSLIANDTAQTLTVSAAVISEDGRTVACYSNLSPASVIIKDVAVLYPAGGFDANFFRGMCLLLFRVMFLAALGLCVGSLVSFPVGCLACFVLYAIALGRGFLVKAVKFTSLSDVDPITLIGNITVQIMSVLLPDFSRSSPVDSFVEGMYISWTFTGETAMLTIAFRTTMLLALACLIFHKRELARVQV